MDEFPFIERGEDITFDLLTGETGVSGILEDFEVVDGSWRWLKILMDEPTGQFSLTIKGDLVKFWRLGRPIQKPVNLTPVPGQIRGPIPNLRVDGKSN